MTPTAGDSLAALRTLLEDARGMAERIDIPLTHTIRVAIEDALEDLDFLEAIAEITG